MPRTTTYCLNCGEKLPEDSRASRKYCSDHCRKESHRLAGGKGKLTEQREIARKLAFENIQDEVREVLRQEIREQITQHVHDNVLGAAESMTHLLPEAMAALKQDLESEDWMARSRAYALVMKYAMSFKDTEPKDGGNQNIVVVSGVPTPDTPFGHAVVEHYEELPRASEGVPAEEYEETSGLEDFEKDWPKCYSCKSHKHPSNMRKHDDRGRYICTSCTITRDYKRGHMSPILEDKSDGLFN